MARYYWINVGQFCLLPTPQPVIQQVVCISEEFQNHSYIYWKMSNDRCVVNTLYDRVIDFKNTLLKTCCMAQPHWAPFVVLHDFRSHHFMANRWGNNGSSKRLYFLGSKITANGDCSHEIKRRLLLGRKVMTNLDSILKSRDITLPTKVHLVKAMVFPVVMHGCEKWVK